MTRKPQDTYEIALNHRASSLQIIQPENPGRTREWGKLPDKATLELKCTEVPAVALKLNRQEQTRSNEGPSQPGGPRECSEAIPVEEEESEGQSETEEQETKKEGRKKNIHYPRIHASEVTEGKRTNGSNKDADAIQGPDQGRSGSQTAPTTILSSPRGDTLRSMIHASYDSREMGNVEETLYP